MEKLYTVSKYGTKVVKTALSSSKTGTVVNIQDVLTLLGITSGYYSLKVDIVDRSNSSDLFCEYIICNNSNGGRYKKILETTDRYIRPQSPTATTITLVANQPSSGIMITFEPCADY